MLRHLIFSILICLLPHQLLAAESDIVLDTAERFARLQTQGIPGKVGITMGKLDVSRLPPCTAHEAYLPAGSRLNGNTYIGVRCLGPNIWSVLVPVQISITGNYVVTLRALGPGQTINPEDLAIHSGDLATLPAGVITAPEAAIGKTLRNALAAGQVLRNDQLLEPIIIRQGQTVRVISKGTNFAVSTEGKAMNNAASGQMVQVRLNSGRTISGTAMSDGTVNIASH